MRLCTCHQLPMYRDKGKKPWWRCHEKRRASKRRYYRRLANAADLAQIKELLS